LQSCDHELEALQKLSDPELSDCPACGQPALKKLISPVGFRLKGSGWYETDFKKGSQKNVAKDEAPAKTASRSAATARWLRYVYASNCNLIVTSPHPRRWSGVPRAVRPAYPILLGC